MTHVGGKLGMVVEVILAATLTVALAGGAARNPTFVISWFEGLVY